MAARAVALALAATLAGPARADEPSRDAAIAVALDEVRLGSTLELSTVGRTSGRIHTRPVWFVVSDGRIYVQSGKDGRTDWYRNVQKNFVVTARAGRYAFRGRATPVTDPVEVERIRRLFLDKYTTAWILSFVGSSLGQGLPVELRLDEVQTRQ